MHNVAFGVAKRGRRKGKQRKEQKRKEKRKKIQVLGKTAPLALVCGAAW